MRANRNLRWALLATVAACAAPGAALAQSAPDGAAATAVDDIVVTARKREEALQDVPISVQVFGAAALEQAGIQDFSEIAYRVPGLKLSAERAVDTELFIRGIGSDIQGAGADGAVGIFVDGVYMSRGTEGAAHYLPAYAGNLDIMTSAALKTAEKIAERIAA